MTWTECVTASEKILNSPQAPSSLDIITLIKKVNPTRLGLSESDRDRGYELKHRLQSLLLEHYGDTFHLIPHPASPNIVLIKHRALPSIDACHADLAALSGAALEKVESAAPLHTDSEHPKRERSIHSETGNALAPKEALKKAQTLLEQYEYGAAEQVLAGLQACGSGDLAALVRGADLLLHEIGAYDRCVEMLLRQPKTVLKDRGLREKLAVAYHHNGSFPEARAILDELHPVELGLEALFAYADIAFKDGNLRAAFELVQVAHGKEGYSSDLEILQKAIETALSAQAEPVARKAEAALQADALDEAGQAAREALELYPNCQTASRVISAIEARSDKAKLAELWEKLEKEQSGERRLALLNALLERDRERRESVRQLMAQEKERQRRRLFDEHLEELRGLVVQESWSKCFDVVTFLMKQPEFCDRRGEVLSLSPFFPVLQENKRLHSTAERSAKDAWLRFVKVKLALAAGTREGCLETFGELKPWFDCSPAFTEEYLVLLQGEQEKARREVASLMLDSEAPERTVGEVRQIHGRLRKRMAVLPVEERRELVRAMEERQARLVPEQAPGKQLAEYREALRIGNSEKVSFLRGEIVDTAAREAIDAEFAEANPVAWEPLSLEIGDSLPVDLTTPPPLLISFFKAHRFFLRDGDDTLVMIDFAARTACRMTSPIFAKARWYDVTRDGTILFVEMEPDAGCRNAWRVEVSADGCVVTASFDIRESFDVEDGFSVAAIFLSTERDTDYYIVIRDEAGRSPGKILRKRLAPKGTVESLQLGNRTELKMWRWSNNPDHFLVGGEGEMRHLNRNLALKGGVSVTPTIYRLDGDNGHVYGVENFRLTRRDFSLKLTKVYENAFSFGLYEPQRYHGISWRTDTALIVVGDGKQTFYNLRNNKFSQKIRAGRVIPSECDGKWYSFDYNREQGKLWLRDITGDIHSNLEWREFFRPQPNRKKMMKKAVWFNEPDNFVYRPGEWEASEPPASW